MKFLICGLGHMGALHKKYLQQLGVEWLYYDPNKAIRSKFGENYLENLSDASRLGVTHVIISSSENEHYNNYITLRNAQFRGPILVEKPVVLEMKHFSIFDDPLVSAGFVEHHNPAVKVLKQNIELNNLISADFTRCSVSSSSNQRIDSFSDVGIHDVDLFFHLFDGPPDKYHIDGFSNTFVLTTVSEQGFLSRFIWSNETSFKERKILVRHKNYTVTADLIEQSVKKQSVTSDGKVLTETLYVEKSPPLLNQLKNFINTDIHYSGATSHRLYLELRDKLFS